MYRGRNLGLWNLVAERYLEASHDTLYYHGETEAQRVKWLAHSPSLMSPLRHTPPLGGSSWDYPVLCVGDSGFSFSLSSSLAAKSPDHIYSL